LCRQIVDKYVRQGSKQELALFPVMRDRIIDSLATEGSHVSPPIMALLELTFACSVRAAKEMKSSLFASLKRVRLLFASLISVSVLRIAN
jgi:hypothetical protein